MSYIGKQPQYGSYSKLDAFTFNGVTTTFTCQVGGTAVTPGSAQNLLVSLAGVWQNPGVDYTVSLNTIIFTTAPTISQSCFVVLLGDVMTIGIPSDGTITDAKMVSVAWAKILNTPTTTAGYGITDGVSRGRLLFGINS
jgi:hypothetical protein